MVEVRFVVDIVSGSSSLFEGLECEEFVVEMRWHIMGVVVWFECDGMFVGHMKMFGTQIMMCTLREFNVV